MLITHNQLQEQVTRLGNINEQLRSDSSVLSNSSSRNSNHDSCDGVGPSRNTTTADDLNTSTTSLLDELRLEDASFAEIDHRDVNIDVNETSNSSFADLTTSIYLTSDEITSNTITQNDNDDDDDDDGSSSAGDLDNIAPEKPPRKDPNRPRYTLGEMQSLLEERNTYKIKMMALEEELELYKEG